MVFTIFKKPETMQRLIDVREAFNLWDILKSKYDQVERWRSWLHMIHDIDFSFILERNIDLTAGNIRTLESLMRKYQVKGPDQGRLSSEWMGNSEVSRDELFAQDLLMYLQEHLENLLRAVRTSVTNDEARQAFRVMAERTAHNIDEVLKYVKLKGWIENCPIYPNTPADLQEIISCASVGSLWDHLTFRYDNLRKTKIYREIIHDTDFRLIVEMGKDKLESQVATLEKECQKFGISLPKRPPEVVVAPSDTYVFNDDAIFRDILAGLQSALIMHAEASKQCFTNDYIRVIFYKLMVEELDAFDKFVKYGKVKNWLHPVPSYQIS